MTFHPGQRVRVVSAPTSPAKCPLKVGDVVTVVRVTATGQVLTNRHGGLYKPERFVPE